MGLGTRGGGTARKGGGLSISIVIPTFGRDEVLTATLGALLALPRRADEIVVVDQTPRHGEVTENRLRAWADGGAIRWVRHQPPSITGALNLGLRAARGDLVLILDDDIEPGPGLVAAHEEAMARHPEAWAVAGQVLQPGELSEPLGYGGPAAGLRAYLEFPFRSSCGAWVENVMAGNLAVRRARALEAGGFDENFVPPVAYRFETEFARRLIGLGGRIWFEPSAGIRHLRAVSGGTRIAGGHLTSAAPWHGAGDYYYALRCGRGTERAGYLAGRPFREVATRFHLAHPWFIPVKFVGELRALLLAWRLYRRGPRLGGGAS